MAGPLPNLHAVNPPPANNPELLLTKSYIVSWLPWMSQAALLGRPPWLLHVVAMVAMVAVPPALCSGSPLSTSL